jgi:hypothetical protein
MVDAVTKNTEESAPIGDATDLNINDLAAMKSIIDVASSRGAFKPNEMVPVGTIYNKLENFLNAAQAQSNADKAKPNA